MPEPKLEKLLMLGVTCRTYYFNSVGDELPVHTHTKPEQNHITIVLSGTIRCIGAPGIDGDVLFPGDCRDWPLGIEHGFVALEDGTKILNIFKESI